MKGLFDTLTENDNAIAQTMTATKAKIDDELMGFSLKI
jgi:hypothetical protein